MRPLLPFFLCVSGIVLSSPEANASCYRVKCDQSQRCQAEQVGPSGGKCCCKVECVGGEGGVRCVCATWCEQPCGVSCPDCNLCGDGESNLATEGFEVGDEAIARVYEQSELAGLLVSMMSGRLAHPVCSRSAEGFSNADTGYEYAYKVRVQAQPEKLVMDFVFDRVAPETGIGGPPPVPVRLVVDPQGNISTYPLAPESFGEVQGKGG
jgi:hypothetical protein